jgi:uncharacterized membrane protein YeaQ/YmgE (transglycosylase-associated protein family)
MTLVEALVLLLVAGLCGGMAQVVTGFRHGLLLVFVGFAFFGGMLGYWIARFAELPDPFAVAIGGGTFPVIWSVMGAIVLVVLVGAMAPRRRL